jgi:hypothetical protein
MTEKRQAVPRPAVEVTGVRGVPTDELARLDSEDLKPLPDGPADRTIMRASSPPRPLPLRDLFSHRLDMIRRAYTGTPESAVWVAAVDPARGIAGAARVFAPDDGTPVHLVMGRHERCDLRLTDPSLSLRHCVLVVRRQETGDLRVRLLDLRTGLGLTGEDGRPLESVSVEGHLFVGMGRYVLMVLLGGEDLSFSDDGGTIYDTLPPRVFFDERQRVESLANGRRGRLLPREEWAAQGYISGTVTRARSRGVDLKALRSRVEVHRPPEPLNLATMPGDRLGTLRVSCAAGEATVPLYDPQVRDGVLLGRYDRCDSSDLPFDLPETVSRVHALLLKEGNRLMVFDTASTFGVRLSKDQEVRSVSLEGKAGFLLGEETDLQWVPQEA